MSIQLTIEADDAEVEEVLKFLKETFSNRHTDEQIFALERTILWLRATDEYAFKVDPSLPPVVHLAFGCACPASSLLAHKPTQSHVSI
jgi:hypothetical protein